MPRKQKSGEYAEDWAAAFAKAKHVVVSPGDRIPVKGLDVTIIEALGKPIARAGAAACKGGGAATLQGFRRSPGFEDLWQLHRNVPAGAEGNPADGFSANLEDTDNTMHTAHYLKVAASDDGGFTVFNSRTNETKRYAARR